VKHYFATGELLPDPPLEERWEIIIQHCRLAVESWGVEDKAMRAMRARLMAYSKGMPSSKLLREKLQHVSRAIDVEEIALWHLESLLQVA
jgi:tRNA-dihydrouridine synthase